MKPPVPADIANDNGKLEDHLAAATMALHKVMEGLEAPAKVIDRGRFGYSDASVQGNSRDSPEKMTDADAGETTLAASVGVVDRGLCRSPYLALAKHEALPEWVHVLASLT
ncbi:hypothetical protein A9174_34385 (plasmid) [Mesorhizobium loti NZP2037]|jgi:hypothetical protein|nr:hypothetical protein [Mesorhizobium loti]ANN62007.1 hypothetical protein A9174_34385 [Mesorhizobium loti NZP2037]